MRWKLLFVAFALVLAIYVRTVNLNEPYINSFDPLYMWRSAESIVTTGHLEARDELRYRPFGWDSREMLPITPYSISSLCFGGCDVKFLAKWQPVVYGVMAMAVMAFIGLKVWNRPELPVLFLALLPGFVLRTAEGFGEKEPIASLLLVMATYFFYRSQQDRPIWHGVFAGVALGMALLSWGGYLLFFIAFNAYMVAKVLVGKIDKKVLAIVPVFALTAIMAMSIPATSEFFNRFDIRITLGAALFSLLTYVFYTPPGEWGLKFKLPTNKRRWQAVGAAAVLLVVLAFGAGFDVLGMSGNAINQFLFPIRGGESGTGHQYSVGEQAATVVVWPWESSSWKEQNQVWRQTGALLAIGMLSIVVAWKTKKDEELLTAILFLFLFHGATKVVRLIFPFMIGVALAGTAVFAWWLKREDQLSRYLGWGVLLVVVVSTMQASLEMAPQVRAESAGDREWFENLKWINLNTQEDEAVVTWWDYGYLIQQIAKRPSVGDGGNVGPSGGPKGDLNWYTGHFFVNSDTQESVQWLEQNDFNVVTMDSSMIGKFYWVSTLGGNSTAFTLFTKSGDRQVMLNDGTPAAASVYVSQSGESVTLLYVNNTLLPVLSFQQGQGIVEDLIRPDGIYKNPNPLGMPVIQGGVYITDSVVMYAPSVAEHSLFTKLYFQFGSGTPFSLSFWNPYTKTYLLDETKYDA